jgi:hypothetical protein
MFMYVRTAPWSLKVSIISYFLDNSPDLLQPNENFPFHPEYDLISLPLIFDPVRLELVRFGAAEHIFTRTHTHSPHFTV